MRKCLLTAVISETPDKNHPAIINSQITNYESMARAVVQIPLYYKEQYAGKVVPLTQYVASSCFECLMLQSSFFFVLVRLSSPQRVE